MKKVKVCLNIALRDFGAFEDLAAELGYDFEVVSLENDDKTPKKKPKVFLDQNAKQNLKEYYKKHPGVTFKEVGKRFGVSETTVHNIVRKEG